MTFNSRRTRRSLISAAATTVAAALALTGCAAESPASPGPVASDGVGVVEELRAMLPQEILDSGVINVALYHGDPPFTYDQGGTAVGVVPDLMAAVADVWGVEFVETKLEFAGMIPALQADQIDVMWLSLFDTLDREKVVDQTTYVSMGMGLLIPAGNPLNIQTMDDLCGKIAGTAKGAAQEQVLTEQHDKCLAEGNPMDMRMLADTNGGRVALQSGTLDAWLGTYAPMAYNADIAPETKDIFDLAPFVIPAGYGAITSRRTLDGFGEAWVGVLKHLEAEGIYQEILTANGLESAILTADQIQLNGLTAGTLE
ncbi:transporter substrate-binding domain-containing protein [Homoserinimonas sp. A520]